MTHRRFVPYHHLGDTPNVIVDGGPTASTVLTLSHWPGSPTPPGLLDDVSAQIAFNALDQPGLLDGIEVVSNNHFDQDGLAGLFALLDPEAALARRGMIIDVATAGDFATFRDRDSMRTAIALAACADPQRSPLDDAIFAGDYDRQCARLYETLLSGFAAMIDHPESTRSLWEAEDAHLSSSLDAIDRGLVRIEEVPALDLAVVFVPDGWVQRTVTRFADSRSDVVHPAAVNQSTSCCRVLLIDDHRYRLELRYESWVMFQSRAVLPRPDLRMLAGELDALEPGSARWRADRPGSLTPMLELVNEPSGLAPEAFRAHLERFLATAPPAWDPYVVSPH